MNQTIYKLTCERCGEEFQATRYWARYCSDACRVADYWKRRKERTVHGQRVDKNEP